MASLSSADALAQLSFLIVGTLEKRSAGHDLSMIQTRLLGVLRDRRPTMNELAKLLKLDKSSTTGLVDRAEKRGLVARSPSPADRRAVLVGLTDRGREIVAEVAAGFERDVVELVKSLEPGERETLTGLASRLVVAHAATEGIDLFTSEGE
jgi:DNA-binding MarR family transcriptional regulator